MKTITAASQKTYGKLPSGIGIGYSGPYGASANQPNPNPKPIKYAPMSGQYKGN